MFGVRPVLIGQGNSAAPYLLSVCLSLLLTEPVARQDISALLGLDSGTARWQAYLVPSAAGSTHAGTVAVAHGSALPAGAGIKTATIADERAFAVASGPSTDVAKPVSDRLIASIGKKSDLVMSDAVRRKRARAISAGTMMHMASLFEADDTQMLPRSHFATGFTVVAGDARTLIARTTTPKSSLQAVVDAAPYRPTSSGGAPIATASVKPTLAVASHAEVKLALAVVEAKTESRTGASPAPSKHAIALAPASAAPEEKNAAQSVISKMVASNKERKCLAIAVYFEARGEPRLGQVAVAQVVVNRVRNPVFPKTICGVVYQNKKWRNRCQFSFACDGIRERIRDKKSWKTAVDVARKVLDGTDKVPGLDKATHYHATYVRPRWARKMKRLKRVGRHIFYRGKDFGWG